MFQKKHASHQRPTDCKDDERIDDIKARILLWHHVLDSIGDDGILYAGDYIPVAFEEGRLLGLTDYITEPNNNMYWYAIKLTSECKAYIRKRILDLEDISDFVHYAIYKGERCIMRVYDSICISIDKCVNIPEWLLAECERNEVWVSMEDSIE